MLLRDIGDFLITAIMPETPISANILLMLGLVCFGVYLGLESLAYFNEGFSPLIFISWLIVIASGLLRADFGWLQPLFVVEPGQLLLSSVTSGSLIVDGHMILLFYSFVTDKHQVLKYNAWAIVIATIIIGAIQVAVVASLSPNLAKTALYPVLELARNAPLGVFLERIEALYLALWIMATFIKVSVLFYANCLGLTAITGVANYRYFILPLALVTLYLSFQADGVVQSILFDAIFNQYALLYDFSLMLLLLLGGLWVRKPSKKRVARGS
ncbi:MAG: hypothetical protein DDT36_01760 [Firmicutes bacterium]|nr:hypothetical protein [Bacillota bacterium]